MTQLESDLQLFYTRFHETSHFHEQLQFFCMFAVKWGADVIKNIDKRSLSGIVIIDDEMIL